MFFFFINSKEPDIFFRLTGKISDLPDSTSPYDQYAVAIKQSNSRHTVQGFRQAQVYCKGVSVGDVTSSPFREYDFRVHKDLYFLFVFVVVCSNTVMFLIESLGWLLSSWFTVVHDWWRSLENRSDKTKKKKKMTIIELFFCFFCSCKVF